MSSTGMLEAQKMNVSPTAAKAYENSDPIIRRGAPAAPIVLGIGGHRRIADVERDRLKMRFGEILLAFRKSYPETPLILLTPLAQGADQLAVEAALDNPDLKEHVWVRAALPFAPAIYRQSTSFDDNEAGAAARLALDRWLKHSRVESFVVPMPPTDAVAEGDWINVASRPEEPWATLRHRCYANAGGYIVRHCHLYVAFWDGDHDPRVGGTYDQIRFRVDGEPSQGYPWTAETPLGFFGDRGIACLIHTPRSPGFVSPPPKPAGDLEIRLPGEASRPITADKLACRLSRFNRFVKRLAKSWLGSGGELRQLHEHCQSAQDFNDDIDKVKGDPEWSKTLAAVDAEAEILWPGDADAQRDWRRISAVREGAAHLARSFRNAADVIRFIVVATVVVGAVLLLLHGHLKTWDPGQQHAVHDDRWEIAYFIALLVGGMLVAAAWWRRLEEKHLDYRSLAEALRVREFWARAGLDASVADSYLSQLRGEVTWVRRALFNVCPPPQRWAERFAAIPTAQKTARLEAVLRDWITAKPPEPARGQIDHLYRSHKAIHRTTTLLNALGLLLIVGALSLTAWKVAGPRISGLGHPPAWTPLLVGAFGILAGAMKLYSRSRGNEELARQYERLRTVYENAAKEARRRLDADDLSGVQDVFQALGREALTENAHWLILRRARPLELHVGH